MTIKYCDYINGDDSTGDGTAGNPYKTITQASIGLTGGDEVRVAKSAAASNLTGTVGFTVNSTAVTGSGTAFTSELAIGDFIKGGDDHWYEVVTITDNTNAVLYKNYAGSTGAGVSSQKLGVTSTGEAAVTTTQVQVVSVSGSSAASMLKVSGGWDLTGPTQDGQTYFRQMHSTFANRYGYGLYLLSKSFVEVERCHFLRYYYGLFLNSASHNTLTSPTCNSCNYGIYAYKSPDCAFTSIICNGNARGIYTNMLYGCTFTSIICNGNTFGVYMLNCYGDVFNTPTFNSNQYGIYGIDGTTDIILTSPTYNNNSTYGIYLNSAFNIIVSGFSGTGNTSADVYVLPAQNYSEHPIAKCQHFKAAGANKCFYEYGITERDTTDARSTQCLKYDPSSATYYISQSFFFKADSGVAQTLSAYVKDDAAFNGDIQAAIYFMGVKITGWSAWTPTTSYVQKSIVAAAGDVTEDGVLELRIKVRGAAGNVFVDDIATS